MNTKLFLILAASFVLIAVVTPAISNADTYTYDWNAAWSYSYNMCSGINNFAASDGTCDDGDVLCAYTYCDPYKFYPNTNNGGTDCANFLSQELIAGGLSLPGNDCPAASSDYMGGGNSGTTWPTSSNIDAFLKQQYSAGGVVTEFKTLTSSSAIPVDIAAGDVMIYYNSTSWHSTFVQGIGTVDNLNPVLGYHGGAGSSLTGGGLVCNASGSYKALFNTYPSCDWFHFGAVSQPPGCVGCTPPSTAPSPPSVLTATQVSVGIQLQWNSTSFGNSNGFYRIYRRPTSTPNISYATCVASIPSGYNLSYIDTLTWLNAVPGTQYSYSIAASNLAGEGCNGPFASNCNWQSQGCSVCSVNEAKATMPSAMTIQNVNIPISPTVITIHGSPIKILPMTNIQAGNASVNFVSP
jgi:hypothetical protein